MDATFALEEDGKLPIKLIASDPDLRLSHLGGQATANGSITGSVLLQIHSKANYYYRFLPCYRNRWQLTSKAAKITLNIAEKRYSSFVNNLKALSYWI